MLLFYLDTEIGVIAVKKRNTGFGKYALAFSVSVILALALLILAAFAPQSRILDNLWESLDYLRMEGIYPHMADYSDSSRLDNFTDILMLLESAATNDGYLGSVLTNPVYVYDHAGADLVELLECYLNQMPHDSVGYYVRYWMGFRVLLRIALTFFSYFQIRRYLAVIFFSLFAAVLCSIAKRVDGKLAFLFALSVILVRPYVMVNSMQYSCCFVIMFLAMLLVPWIYRNPKWEGIFFMEIGVVTMYFDFYTVPLITVGFPLVYLCALQLQDGKNLPVKKIGIDLVLWMTGYVLMWLAKLTLTSMLTSVNALANGLGALLGRIGVTKTSGLEEFYSLSRAAECLRDAIFCDREGMVFFLAVLTVIVIAVVCTAFRKKVTGRDAVTLWPLLCLAMLPFLWFLATIQPLAMHHYFQYRIIALTYWGAGAYVYFLLWGKKHTTE